MKREYIQAGLLILVAYIFSVGIRYIYFGYVDGVDAYHWHHQLMINNVDGYYYMQGARDILEGTKSYLSPIDHPLAILTAFIAKFLHLDIDTIALYFPGFLGSLVVVPLVLIGRSLGSVYVGFLAALLAGIAWSYYHRTMFGYYDTDLLVVVLPLFAIWAVIEALKNNSLVYGLLAGFFEIVMIAWHGGLYNVGVGIAVIAALYVMWRVYVKKEATEQGILLFLIIPLLHLSLLLASLLLIASFILLKRSNLSTHRFFLPSLALLFTVAVVFPWLANILQNRYFTREVATDLNGSKYFDVVNTVREAGHISYDTFVHRISGSWIGFIAGLIGYLLLLIRYPVMWVSLPMVFLGFFALQGGLRFTIFAVPFMALGDAYIAHLIASFAKRIFINDKVAKISEYMIATAIMIGFIYPNYRHIHEYIMPTTFNKAEVVVLDKLHSIAKPQDFVMTWWDYGYPIRYYARLKTFVDGGKHSGNVNYPVSFALTRPLLPSYNMANLDAYYTDLTDKNSSMRFDILKWIKEYYHLKSIDEVEAFLSQRIELPKVKEDIYYFLPFRMLGIFPTVALFSQIDPKSGKVKKRGFFYVSNGVQKRGDILLSGGIKIDLKRALILLGKQQVPIKRFAIVSTLQNGKTIKRVQQIRAQGINVIIMQSYGKVLLLDDFYYDSSYIQMFVLDTFDDTLFSKVIDTPVAKVFKVKKVDIKK